MPARPATRCAVFGSAVTLALASAAIRPRAVLLDVMQQVMGELPERPAAPPKVEILEDGSVEVEGVRECVEAVRQFPRGHLAVEHRDCAHDFPAAIRERAWRWREQA